jgi:hypothetical protein
LLYAPPLISENMFHVPPRLKQNGIPVHFGVYIFG